LAKDIRGPLGFVVSSAQVLENDCTTLPEEEICRYLRAIVQKGRDMIAVVDGMLDTRAGPPKEVTEEIAPLEMGHIVGEVLERMTYAIEETGARVIVPERWPVPMGHAAWVEEVWFNLLSNAIKFGGQPPRVEIGASRQGEEVRFWVRDNGLGLSLEEQVRLFAQTDQSWTTDYGLELALVQRIVRKLGGEVGVESEVGKGSTFFFTLPAAE
jgi:signal transduction histidine kinase